MLSLNSITYQIDKKTILDQVSLDLLPGEVCGIVGKNGAGKSTLVKIASGALRPTKGSVFYHGKGVESIQPTELGRRRAVLTQDIEGQFSFTVLDYLLMARYPYRPLNTGDFEALDDIVKRFSIDSYLEREFFSLSGGEKQRVRFAKALLQLFPFKKDSYLFLDEPTSFTDLEHQQMILETTRQVAIENKIGVMLVIHDLNQAIQYCDVLHSLESGKVTMSGKPSEVLSKENVDRFFNVKTKYFFDEKTNLPILTI